LENFIPKATDGKSVASLFYEIYSIFIFIFYFTSADIYFSIGFSARGGSAFG